MFLRTFENSREMFEKTRGLRAGEKLSSAASCRRCRQVNVGVLTRAAL